MKTFDLENARAATRPEPRLDAGQRRRDPGHARARRTCHAARLLPLLVIALVGAACGLGGGDRGDHAASSPLTPYGAEGAPSGISFDVGATAVAVTRGPYLQSATPTSVVIRWRTDAASDSRVGYGPSPDALGSTVDDAQLTTEHELRLDGLAPATRYYYSVGTTRGPLASGLELYFWTPPVAHTAASTRIWLMGDASVADAGSRAVRDAYAALAAARHTDVWLTLGDNAYWTGTDAELQSALFDNYAGFLRQTALWPTIGNHDSAFSPGPVSNLPYHQVFTLPTGGEAGGLASGTEDYYSFDHANVHFVCLDSMTVSRAADGPMLTWLRDDLASNTQDWTIAYWHHSPYSKGSHDSDWETEMSEMRRNALPILEQYGVDLVFSGHSHAYERSFLLDGHYGTSSTFTASMKKNAGDGRPEGNGSYSKPGGGPAPHQGAVYVVAGSAQAVETGPFGHPAMYTSIGQLGSMVLDVDGNRLDARFLRETGAVDDHFSIVKGPDFDVAVAPASIGVVQGEGATVTVTVTGLLGFAAPVTLAAAGLPEGVSPSFSTDPVTPTASTALNLNASSGAPLGSYAVTVTGTSGATARAVTFALTVGPPGVPADVAAAYDPGLKAPRCATVGRSCDSGTLLVGRGPVGPEPGQPNTINGSCADGASGSFHDDESNDRITVASVDGAAMTMGTVVQVSATVWAYSSYRSDALDLYAAANANSPTWTLLGTVVPTRAGAQVLSRTFTLPDSTLQAVRARFRYQGSASPCRAGEYDDHDDLVFAVASPPPDFGVAVAPASLTVIQGASDAATVNVASLYGFASPVALSVAGSPAEVTVSLLPGTVTPSAGGTATSNLLVSASPAAAPGTYAMTVVGAAGSQTRAAPLTLTVTLPPQPDFTVAVAPTAVTVVQGSGGGTIVSVAGQNGFASPVELALSGLPDGVEASFSSNTVTPPGTSTATFSASPAATTGAFTVTVTGASGGLFRSAALTLTVSPPGPVTVFADGAESAATALVLTSTTSSTQWTRGTSGPYAGTYRWKAGSATGGNYGNRGDARMTTPGLSLTGATSATLTYAFKHRTESGYDYFEVRLSADGGTTWTNLVRVSGRSAGYSAWAPMASIDLTPWAGQADVRLQFRLTTDASVTDFGVAVDEIKVVKQ